MDKDRRDFLKVAGVTVVGVGGAAPLLARAAGGHGHGSEAAEVESKTRWAMVVDTTKCMRKEGCRACMEACHGVHNVPAIADPKEEVKWLWKEPLAHVFHERVHERSRRDLAGRPVPVLCNHCDNPPCVRVCPTQATFRRDDGLVMMDQHRCIGCRYCMVGCPYGARSFNWSDPRRHLTRIDPIYPTRTKGVVEKCTFCAERLAKGQPPACVEACKGVGVSALVFGDLSDKGSDVYKLVHDRFLERRKAGLGTRPQVYYVL